MDRDFDGYLTFEEFIGEESQIEKLFKNMDKDGDGVVTKEVGTLCFHWLNRGQVSLVVAMSVCVLKVKCWMISFQALIDQSTTPWYP